MLHLDPQNLIVSTSFFISGLLFILLSLPLRKRWIPKNQFYGFRIPKAMESDENWYAINTYGAERIIVWAFLLIGLGALALLMPIAQNKALAMVFGLSYFIIFIPIAETISFAKRL